MGDSDPVISCPECGDRLYEDGTRVTLAQMDADHAAMQAIRDGRCVELRQVNGNFFVTDAMGRADNSDTPERAISGLLALQPA